MEKRNLPVILASPPAKLDGRTELCGRKKIFKIDLILIVQKITTDYNFS